MTTKMITMTMDDWMRFFGAREPTDEEMRPVAEAIASRIEKEVDQGFIDEMTGYKIPKPMMPLTAQKRVTLLKDAIRTYESRGQDVSGLQEDLAYLESKYRGQPREQ